MNNENKIQEITAADVVAFLQSEAAKLATAVDTTYTYVYVEAGNPDYPNGGLGVTWKTYSAASGEHTGGATLDEAVGKQIAAGAPEARAKAKREAAAKLLAEADTLTPKGATT